jgi:hypothetical protein
MFSKNVAAVFLGLILLAIVAGAILLSWDGAEIPSLLEILGGAAVGALAALVTNDG